MEVDPKNVKPRENTSLKEEVDTDIGKLTSHDSLFFWVRQGFSV